MIHLWLSVYYASWGCPDPRHQASRCGTRFDGQTAFADGASESGCSDCNRRFASYASEAAWVPTDRTGIAAACAADYQWTED